MANATKRTVLTDISSKAFEHGADRKALKAMRRVPGFDGLMRRFISLTGERQLRYLFLGNAARAESRQFPKLYNIVNECAEVLDIPAPEVFVGARTELLESGAMGVEDPFILLPAARLDLPEEELRFFIGQELGQILSGHIVFKTMRSVVAKLSNIRINIPLTGLAFTAVLGALGEWYRTSAFSRDRAGLLVCQDPNVAYRHLMRETAGRHLDDLSMEVLLEQALAYRENVKTIDTLLKLLSVLNADYPFAVLRLAELLTWVENGDFQVILEGSYPRRTVESDEVGADDEGVDPKDDRDDPAYRFDDDFEGPEGEDPAAGFAEPLLQVFQSLGSQINQASTSLWSKLRTGIKDRAEKRAKAQAEGDGDTEPKADEADEADASVAGSEVAGSDVAGSDDIGSDDIGSDDIGSGETAE